ncbi:MAG: twin transmembrane helix small protein [Methylovirgula sp.]
MHTLSNFLVAVAILAVTFVLFMGLANMLRGGSPNLSQKLTPWRGGLQFRTILLIMDVLYFRS